MCDLIRWNELDVGILIARYIQSRYHTATPRKIMQLLQSNSNSAMGTELQIIILVSIFTMQC